MITRDLGSRQAHARLALGMHAASFQSKQPSVHFQFRLHNASNEHASQQEEARANFHTYVGPSPLSYLVAEKKNDFCQPKVQLLSVVADVAHGFGFQLTMTRERSHAIDRKLVVAPLWTQ